jgi:hypothetical protein
VRNGAQLLLEYSAAKFALGSNQGRRLVPFRRRLGAVRCILGAESPTATQSQECVECYNDCDAHFFEIFLPNAYDDHQIWLGLLQNGQSQQLLNGLVPISSVDAAASTAQFAMDPMIADLAINKQVPYLQRIHHAGYEIYASGPATLITAGGVQTDHADHFTIGGVPLNTPKDQAQDVGGGLPTTVMFTGDPGGVTSPQGQSRMTIQDLITLRGNLNQVGSDDNGFTDESFTDNLCVWYNFACGLNLTLPPDIAACLIKSPTALATHWFFFNSGTCLGYKSGPSFFLALYAICPQNRCFVSPPPGSAGFLEVVDNPSETFESFQATTLSNNPHQPSGDLGNLGQGCVTGGDCTGHYHTASGHDLELALRGHQDDSDKTGIASIDGVSVKDLDDWDFAEGDIITSSGDGAITIRNPRLGTQVILDFTDTNHPCRRVGPGAACTQQ